MKKTLFLFVLIFSMTLLCLSSCSLFLASVSYEDITLEVGEKAQLLTDITVSGKSMPIEYSFEGSNISIDNGFVTGLVAETVTTVTASATGMETAEFKVTVNRAPTTEAQKPNTDVEMSFNDMKLTVGDTANLVKSVKVGNETKQLSYSFEGAAIGIDNYVLTALTAGTETVVTVTAEGFNATFKVTVENKAASETPVTPEASDVVASLNDITVEVGEGVNLVSFVKVGGETKLLNYSFEGENISIASGVLTGIVENTTTTVKATADGFEGSFKVSVVAKDESGESIGGSDSGVTNLGFKDLALELGDTVTLLESITVGGEEKALRYTFTGNSISIENSVLTALVHGTSTNVVVTAAGFRTSFNVTVSGDVGTMSIEAPEAIYSNYPGKDITVSFSKSAFATDVTFTTDNENVKVENGKIYATGLSFPKSNDKEVKYITVNVTAKSLYHEQTFAVKVSVFNQNSAEEKVQYYEDNIINVPGNKGGTIFVGDSYFDGYTIEKPPFWSDFYTDYANEEDIFLMGISSSQIDTLEIVSERIVYPMEPSEIVVHIGFNDVHHGSLTVEELYARISALLTEYHEKLPDTKIYFIGVEPKKNGYTSGTSYYESSTVKAPALTALMKSMAEENDWFTYVDTLPIFINSNGTVNTGSYLSTDLSHPTLAAYDEIRKAINAARGVTNIEDSSSSDTPERDENTVYIDNLSNGSVDINSTGYFVKDSSGNNLTGSFVASGKIKIAAATTANAPHLQWRFSQASRFLLWDSDKDGYLGFAYIHAGTTVKDPDFGREDYTVPCEFEWTVVATDAEAYLYIGDELIHKFEGVDFSYFNIGGLHMNVEISDIELTLMSDDSDAYNAILTEKGITY